MSVNRKQQIKVFSTSGTIDLLFFNYLCSQEVRIAKELISMKYFTSILLLFIFTLTSCIEEEDYGYPSEISFPKNGGMLEFSGNPNCSLRSIEILNYNGDGNSASRHDSETSDSITVITGWLTVESPKTINKLILSASANTTHKDRKLYLYLSDGRSRQEIKVKQSK